MGNVQYRAEVRIFYSKFCPSMSIFLHAKQQEILCFVQCMSVTHKMSGMQRNFITTLLSPSLTASPVWLNKLFNEFLTQIHSDEHFIVLPLGFQCATYKTMPTACNTR